MNEQNISGRTEHPGSQSASFLFIHIIHTTVTSSALVPKGGWLHGPSHLHSLSMFSSVLWVRGPFPIHTLHHIQVLNSSLQCPASGFAISKGT